MSTTRPITIRRKTARPPAACAILLIFVCVAMAVGAWFILNTQQEVKSAFGPAQESLNPLTRVYYALRLSISQEDLLKPRDISGSEVIFEIKTGEPVGSVAYRLETAGIIQNAEVFRLYLIYTGQDRSLQAGKYKISPAVNAIEIAGQLQDATPAEVIFSVLAGWRLEEIAASLPTTGLNISPEEFLAATQVSITSYLPDDKFPETSSLEGFLFPGEYTLSRDATVDQVISTAISGFRNSVPRDILEGFTAQRLGIDEAVTLASIVQREAVVADEQPMIASVFINRLSVGMKLDSDPTVQYALGYNIDQKSWWTNPLSAQDLLFDSDFNTYLNPGLPPAPISNPGLPALRAVAFPASSPYYYFRAKCDGSGMHSFAVTFDEHLNNACP